ncbi:M14 family zinc carboxypeptidase, partial [Stigmatella aurantiaca]
MTELLTRAEASNYTETSRHADVVAFADELCRRTKLARRVDFGKSGEGQPMVALVLSDRGCFTPELARKQKKTVVMVEANIHAGEVEGKEAVLALARDLTLSPLGKKLLDKLCLVLIPDFNPDGNDRISTSNRKLNLKDLEGQLNPAGGVGTRYTGEGWNLNRDSTKQEAPETRCMAALYQAWWPHLFIDCHTTDGSIHAFDLTFDTSHSNEPLFAELRHFNRELLERVAKAVKRRHGFDSFWYGNYRSEGEPRSGWHTYPALPRFGSHYRGLLGRLDVLLETYSYIGFPRRCEVMRAWLLELFRDAAKNAAAYRAHTEAEEKR